jgi:hypothetical protein
VVKILCEWDVYSKSYGEKREMDVEKLLEKRKRDMM